MVDPWATREPTLSSHMGDPWVTHPLATHRRGKLFLLTRVHG